MADNVVFLEPGDERAQKIAKAMGSQTASDILQILGEGPRSLTDITERLNIPMNTAKYHIENLMDAGLIAVEKTKYSIKGRQVKIYTLTNQLLVVAPRQADARSLLLKYASLFGIVAAGTVLISALSPLFGAGSMVRGSLNTMNMAPPEYVLRQADGVGVAKAVSESIATNGSGAPETLAAGSRGAADAWAANVSAVSTAAPAPAATASPVTTLAASPPALPPVTLPVQVPAPVAQGSLEYGAGYGAALPAIDPAVAFFLGGALVIFVLLVYEAWVWKKHYR